MPEFCDVLLYGTMSDIGDVARASLETHGLKVAKVEFPQNTYRDFWGYGRGIHNALLKHSPRLIIPVGDALALSQLRDRIPEGIGIAVDKEENIALLDSKVRTYELAESLGILQPERHFPAGFDTLSTEPELRVIFKRDVSFGGSGVHRPRNIASLKNLYRREEGLPCLVEDLIDGEDLSVDCVRYGGFFRAGCYVSLGREYTQGPSAQRRSVPCREACEAARTVLDRLDYQGVCGFDFRRTPDGRLYLLEANPRFTGGLDTQIEAGFDIPWLIWEHFVN